MCVVNIFNAMPCFVLYNLVFYSVLSALVLHGNILSAVSYGSETFSVKLCDDFVYSEKQDQVPW